MFIIGEKVFLTYVPTFVSAAFCAVTAVNSKVKKRLLGYSSVLNRTSGPNSTHASGL